MITGREFVQKLFSEGAEEVEKTYSEGFEDGYEYAQREFAEKDEEKKSNAGKVMAGTGAAAMGVGLAAGGKNLHTLNKVSKRAGYKNMIDQAINGTGYFIKGTPEHAKAMKGDRMIKAAMKNKTVKKLGVAANVGQTVGAGLLAGAAIHHAKNKKKD